MRTALPRSRLAVTLALAFFAGLLALAPAVQADPARRYCTEGRFAPQMCIREAHVAYDLCALIEGSAQSHGLPPAFLARLLWQESRFDRNALSPAGAQGIAQFMPGTAKLRGLPDSYDPALAVEYSARYLGALARRYGNLGLAAVAYNGGEGRADGFLARTGGLAGETRDYVRIITGLSAEDWRDAAQDAASPGAADGLDLALAPGPFAPACQALARTRKLSKPKTPAPTYAPWGVQLASGDSAEGARRRFAQRARPCRRALAGERPQIIRKAPQVAGRRTYFVARIGRASRGEANRLCKALRRQTCACAVYRN